MVVSSFLSRIPLLCERLCETAALLSAVVAESITSLTPVLVRITAATGKHHDQKASWTGKAFWLKLLYAVSGQNDMCTVNRGKDGDLI